MIKAQSFPQGKDTVEISVMAEGFIKFRIGELELKLTSYNQELPAEKVYNSNVAFNLTWFNHFF